MLLTVEVHVVLLSFMSSANFMGLPPISLSQYSSFILNSNGEQILQGLPVCQGLPF